MKLTYKNKKIILELMCINSQYFKSYFQKSDPRKAEDVNIVKNFTCWMFISLHLVFQYKIAYYFTLEINYNIYTSIIILKEA